jgi:hypothetical protein
MEMPRRLNLAKCLAFVISIVAFGCLTGLVVMAAIYNSSTCPQEVECSQNQPGNVIPDIHFPNTITPTHVVTTLEDGNVVEQSENAVIMTDIYDSPDKLPDFVQRTPIGNRLPDSDDNNDDDSVTDQSTTIMSNNVTEKRTLESESISGEPQVPEIIDSTEMTKLMINNISSSMIEQETDPFVIQDVFNTFTSLIEKRNRETNSNINVEKPSRKIVGKNKIQPSVTGDETELLTGIASSTKEDGIASSAASFDGNETVSLDIEKKVNGIGNVIISDSINKDETLTVDIHPTITGIASSKNDEKIVITHPDFEKEVNGITFSSDAGDADAEVYKTTKYSWNIR